MPAQSPSPSLLKILYTQNPFYAISAVLMLYAVRAGYGKLEIGEINCWLMLGVLVAYTLALALIGVLIVRRGKVWEDARSIVLLLLLLFLAVSISADDLFVRLKASDGGRVLLLSGYLFSAVVFEAVLWGAGVRLGLWYRVPYHLMLALFFVAPWSCAQELEPGSRRPLEWLLLSFPVAGAVLFLSLLPAVRRGAAYVAENGTPWRWPMFPWTAFGVIAAAVALRSFALCMTFSPHGPIWHKGPRGLSISFDTMWGPYFLVPLGLSLLLLLLENGIVTRSKRFSQTVLAAAPALLMISVPFQDGFAFRRFLVAVIDTIGSPVWITAWLLVAFYVWAALRRVSGAWLAVVATLGLLTVIGPRTVSLKTLAEPQPLAMFLIAWLFLVHGLWNRSSRTCFAAAVAATAGLWFLLPDTRLSLYRFSLSYHALWFASLGVGLAFRDPFAAVLRLVGAVQMPLAALVVLTSPRAADVPTEWRLTYVCFLAAVCLAIAVLWRSRWYLYAFTVTLALAGYGGSVVWFRRAVELLGRPAVTAFAWSVSALILAFLISAHKASWLPRRLVPRWENGHQPDEFVAEGEPTTSDDQSSAAD